MHSTVRTLALALLLLAGCGGGGLVADDAGTAGTDAFVERDAFTAVDTGVDAATVDSGPRDVGTRDSAAPADAGPILPDRDAGDPFGDAGPAGPPAWVPLEVLTDGSECDPLVACGGDIVGTWDVSGGCVEVPVPEELMMCPTASLTAVGMARGRVTFDGTTAVRAAQSEVIVSVFVPGLCAAFVGGCDAIETMIQGMFPDAACRESATADCDCDIRQGIVIDDTDGYTIEGFQIVSATLGKRWDYCVGTDGTMRYRDVSPSGTIEPGIITLTER